MINADARQDGIARQKVRIIEASIARYRLSVKNDCKKNMYFSGNTI